MDTLDAKSKGLFALVPIAVFKDKRLTKTDLRVLCALLSFMTLHKNYCWPKRATIAKRCGGLSVSKISTATRRLVRFGWLIKKGDGGKSCSSYYIFTVPAIFDESRTEPASVIDSETLTDSVTANVTISGTGKKETNKKTIEKGIAEDSFNQFWNVYPRKCNRQDAIRAWSELSPSQLLQEQIIAAVAASVANNPQWQRDGGRFIPFPATYLCGRRWEDQLIPQQPHDDKFISNQHYTSQTGDLYANNQPRRNRREHSAHIGSTIDAIIRSEFGAEFGPEMDSTSF